MARFNYAVKYAVIATCLSPLRTGDAEGGVETVLLGSDGMPMIQGSSIAGALRAWVEHSRASEGSDAARSLFGDSLDAGGDGSSPLTVSDGTFKDFKTQTRPRLRMNPQTGAGDGVGKFEMCSVETGSTFGFDLLLQTMGRDQEKEQMLEEALSALHSGLITLGGQSSNGFGRVRLEVKRRHFDLTRQKHRQVWLQDSGDSALLELKPMKIRTVTFTVTGTTSGVLVRSGRSEQVKDEQNEIIAENVNTAMKDADTYVLPGSSLKGVIRSRASLIADYLNCPEVVTELFGSGGDAEAEAGAGRVRVRECRIKDVKKRVITRTRINRFTGGVMEKKLFSEEPVSGSISIQAEVLTRHPEVLTRDERCLGLLFYALRDFAMGLYGIGSEGSIGRGYIRDGELKVVDADTRCTLRFKDGRSTCTEGDTAFVERWLRALEGGGQA